MGDTKVELGDGVTTSYGSELVVRSEDLEGAMNSMKQHAPIWNGVKADYPAWLWEAVPFLDSMGLKKYRPPVLNEEQHTNMLKHGTQDEITKAESMLEKLFRAFLRMISRSKDHPEAITLRMMVQAEFAVLRARNVAARVFGVDVRLLEHLLVVCLRHDGILAKVERSRVRVVRVLSHAVQLVRHA